MAEFAESFVKADHVIVTEIFASREARYLSVSRCLPGSAHAAPRRSFR